MWYYHTRHTGKQNIYLRMVHSMRSFKELIEKIRGLSDYSKVAIKMGALMMLSFYITGAVAFLIAPYIPNYFGAISVFRGSMEAAPASLVAGVCAAVLCDLAMKTKRDK